MPATSLVVLAGSITNPLFFQVKFDEHKETSIITSMEHKEEKITNEKLAELIESMAVNLASFEEKTTLSQQEVKRELKTMKQEIEHIKSVMVSKDYMAVKLEKIEEGVYTPDEKEDLMAMVRHINKRMENEALGKKDITLTREEYDGASGARGFPNRFNAPQEIVVD